MPKSTLVEGASPRPVIHRVLEVRWARAISVLAAVLAGEILAVAGVYFACRNVLVRDHGSYMSIARLLKLMLDMPGVEGRSVDTGKKLAERMKPATLRYRTRPKQDGNLEVVLARLPGGADKNHNQVEEGSSVFRDGRYC